MINLLERLRAKTRNHITSEEQNALTRYVKLRGRYWKRELNICWETGNYDCQRGDEGLLQTLRNRLGPRWLYTQTQVKWMREN